jgi:uncharacterized protein (TIGR00725 family)
MGGAVASERTLEHARELGRRIAEKGWVLLNGGRDCGVMAASAAGAADADGLVVGILPGENFGGVAPGVEIAVPTGMGDGRNVINVLASRVVVALPGGAGTLSEVALALKNGRPVIALDFELGAAFAAYYESGRLVAARDAAEAVLAIERFLGER